MKKNQDSWIRIAPVLCLCLTAFFLAPGCPEPQKPSETTQDSSTPQDSKPSDDRGPADRQAPADNPTPRDDPAPTDKPAPRDDAPPEPRGEDKPAPRDAAPADKPTPRDAAPPEPRPTETAGEKSPDASGNDAVPTNGTALLAWLQAGKYKNFTKESAIQNSQTAHGSRVRIYINSIMEASFKAGNKNHTQGSAIVKELYTSSDTLRGYAVMVKTGSTSSGQNWYWYEIISGSVVADGQGVSLCTGCHSAGTDFVRTTYPLK